MDELQGNGNEKPVSIANSFFVIFLILFVIGIVGGTAFVLYLDPENLNERGDEMPVVNVNPEEGKIEEIKIENVEVSASELPSFSQENIDSFGLQTIFIEPSKVAENGDREYFFEPFGVSFVVPAKYADYYVMDSMWGEMSAGQTVDFLTKEEFIDPPVVDGAGRLIHFGRMTQDSYVEFNNVIEIEGGTKEPDVKIGEFNVQKFVVPSFGSTKLYIYIVKIGDYYYDFHAPEDNTSFIEEIIKSVKFQG